MVDEDRVATEEQVLCEHDTAPIRRLNRGSGGRPQVDSRMRRAWLPVEQAAMPEIAPRHDSGDRRCEWLRPVNLRRHRRIDPAGFLIIARRARLILRA